MKKYIFLMFLLICAFFFISNNANASSILEPQWAEFCPPLYENVVFKPQKANSKRDMENNYWALRKAKFDKSIVECKTLSKDASQLNACFMRVANLERNKNAQRSEEKYEKSVEQNQQMRDGGYWWY